MPPIPGSLGSCCCAAERASTSFHPLHHVAPGSLRFKARVSVSRFPHSSFCQCTCPWQPILHLFKNDCFLSTVDKKPLSKAKAVWLGLECSQLWAGGLFLNEERMLYCLSRFDIRGALCVSSNESWWCSEGQIFWDKRFPDRRPAGSGLVSAWFLSLILLWGLESHFKALFWWKPYLLYPTFPVTFFLASRTYLLFSGIWTESHLLCGSWVFLIHLHLSLPVALLQVLNCFPF